MYGRDDEIRFFRRAIANALNSSGAAVLIRGEAGLGKSTLADAVAEMARARGFRVLTAHGIRSGSAVGLEGLHELLHPLLGGLGDLPSRQAASLAVAFGITDGKPADRLITGIATFGLIEEAAESQPLMLIVEDLHWIDQSTTEILGFLAPRLQRLRVLLVGTARSGRAYRDLRPAFSDVLEIRPLSDADSAALVRERSTTLSPQQQGAIVALAQGNPLALTELTGTAEQDPGSIGDGHRLATTARIERAFLYEIALLPTRARDALVLVAAGEDVSVDELHLAATALGLDATDFTPAENIGLIRAEGPSYVFRHPLIGSALYDNTDPARRRAVEAALAGAIAEPARALRHRALSVIGRDDAVAAALEKLAEEATRRGALSEAMEAWRRSADLTPERGKRAQRMVSAAETARQAGASERAAQYLRLSAADASGDEETLFRHARTDWLLGSTADFSGRTAQDFVNISHNLGRTSDRIEVLVWAATQCFIGQVGETGVCGSVRHELSKIDPGVDERARHQRIIGLSLLDPAGRPLDAQIASAQLSSPLFDSYTPALATLAFAAEASLELEVAEQVWSRAAETAHRSGRVSDEAVVLANRGAVRGFTDNLNAALTDSEQSMRIGGDLGIPIVGALAAANVARIRAARGEDESAQSALAAVAQLPGAVPRVTAIAAWAEGVVSLNGGRNLHAQAALAKTLEHPPVGLWAGADIADAAARAGDFDQLRQWLELATTSVRAERSNRLWICVLRARALLSGGHAAGEYLEQALCRKDAGATLEYARCQLAFGEWLRRERRIIEARRHLSVALKTFERNAAAPLAQRARAELRAAGVADNASLAREETSSALSAQELLVAQLAAEGLTNKEIADQVYLSHRTVGAYLHSAFSKLGISRRSQLATALRPAREVLP